MYKTVVVALLCGTLLGSAQTKSAGGVQQPEARTSGKLALSEFNIAIDADIRTFVVMAAVNVAGFSSEPANQPLSPARVELRKDLAGLDPAVKAKLESFYKSHRRPGVEETVDAMRYAALSILMAQPPSFEIYQQAETLPQDLRDLTAFVPLVREFYLTGGIKQLAPKYLGVGGVYSTVYREMVSGLLYDVINYLHAAPETLVSLKPLVIESGDSARGKKRQQIYERNRSRNVFVIPEPLAALSTSVVRDDILNRKEDLLSRKIGDDYIVIAGPSRVPNNEAVRQALIRFVIDPVVERHLKEALEFKEQITQLVASVPSAAKEFGPSVYLVIRESLARAVEARMRRIAAAEDNGSYSEDDATNDLAQSYLRGAVLSFHCYEALTGLEKVGIGIEEFFDQMIATTKFDRESKRSAEFEPVVARVSAARRAASAASSSAPSARGGAAEVVAQKIVLSNDLIQQRRFSEAKPLLEEILAVEPNNARALFGIAQVVNQIPSAAELDPKADENDKIQAQYERLEKALKMYRKAIEAASPASEKWLIQWSHVFIGRILDFQDFRADAVAEYDKAITLGDLPKGAYREALEGKQRPHVTRKN